MSKLVKVIAANIRHYRLKRGFTQERLADMIKMDNGTISRFELGKMSPNAETLEKIAKALDIEPHQLLIPIE